MQLIKAQVHFIKYFQVVNHINKVQLIKIATLEANHVGQVNHINKVQLIKIENATNQTKPPSQLTEKKAWSVQLNIELNDDDSRLKISFCL